MGVKIEKRYDADGDPYWEWLCERCDALLGTWDGGDVECDNCHAVYNSFGQRKETM